MKNRRKIYIVDKSYQWKFMAAFTGVSILGISAAISVILFNLHRGFEENIYRSHLKLSSTGQILLPVIFKVSLPFLLIEIIIISLIALYYSRKADGLVMEMTECLKELEHGNLRFNFGSHREEVPSRVKSSFNRMIFSNHAIFSKLKALTLEMEEALKKPEPGEARLKTAEIKKTLDGFHLE